MALPILVAFISSVCLVRSVHGLPVTTNSGDAANNATDEYSIYVDQLSKMDSKHPETAETMKRLAHQNNVENPENEEALWNSGYRNRPDEEKRMRVQQMLDLYNARLLRERGDPKYANLSEKERKELMRKAVREYKQWDRIEDELYERHKKMKHAQILKRLKDAYGAGYDQILDEIKKTEEQRKESPKMREPGSVPQLKEVDDLGPEDRFDPIVFFRTHDLNGDNVLDAEEIEAVLQSELHEAFNENNRTYDAATWDHELNLMRQHFLQTFDTNDDMLITMDEFLDGIKRAEVQRDDGWDPSMNKTEFSKEELEQLAKERHNSSQIHNASHPTPSK